MKLTSFNCTIELSKDANGYSNNYYIDVNDNGVNISHPYITQIPEQIMFVANLIHDFVAQAIAFNNRIDGFNRDNHLEQYAPIVSPEESTEEEKAIAATKLSAEQELELADKSAAPQSCALGDGEVSTGAGVKIKDVPFEEVTTESDGDIDKAKSTIVITKVTEEDNW